MVLLCTWLCERDDVIVCVNGGTRMRTVYNRNSRCHQACKFFGEGLKCSLSQ